MKLSTKGRYGVEAMIDLALHCGSEPVSIKSISKRQAISEAYLEQLFAPLRKAKLIKSIRGAQGGYVLGKDPKDIFISDILDVLEGPIGVSECVEEQGKCGNSSSCPTRLLWVKIKESIDRVTKAISLQDMMDDYNGIKTDKEK